MTKAIVEIIKITDLSHHENADALDIVKVGQYNIVVKKGDFKTGDLGLFISVDSVVPLDFLEHYNLHEAISRGRVKTKRLRGVYSQGLVLPLTHPVFKSNSIKVGQDWSEKLGIYKYQPPVKGRPDTPKKPLWARRVAKFLNDIGIRKIRKFLPAKFVNWGHQVGFFNFRNFWPTGLVVYDIESAQSPKYQSIFIDPATGKGETVVLTEKVHGRHVVAGYFEDEFFVCSRRVKMNRPKEGQFEINWTPVLEAGLEEKLKQMMKELGVDSIAIRGENFGPQCQYLLYGRKKPEFIAFDLEAPFGKYLDPMEFSYMMAKYNIPAVPMLYKGPFDYKVIEEIVEQSSTVSSKKDQLQEGVVIKPLTEGTDPRLGRKILKYISKRYAEKSADVEENADE